MEGWTDDCEALSHIGEFVGDLDFHLEDLFQRLLVLHIDLFGFILFLSRRLINFFIYWNSS